GLAAPDHPRGELNAARIIVGSPSGGGLVTGANVGCKSGDEPCPNDKYTFLTGALMADIVGYHAAADIQALVLAGTLKIGSIPPDLCGGQSPCPSTGSIDKGAILTWIYPTQLVATNLTTYATVMWVSTQETATGT